MDISLKDFLNKGMNIKVDTKEPIIWKFGAYKVGECRGERSKHRWSLPASTPGGLMTECFDCGKTRIIEVEKRDVKKEKLTQKKEV